jgi:hypothetical protein
MIAPFQWGSAIKIPPPTTFQNVSRDLFWAAKEKYICHWNDSHNNQSHFYPMAVELALSFWEK